LDLDEKVDRFTLDIDGHTVRYAHGPPLPKVIEWPGPQGRARIELTPASAGGPIEYTGPWALLRLFDQAAVQNAGAPGRFRVIFNVGGHKASFEVETDVRANPFRLRELEHFDCPLGNP
jgi:type VI secretion system protein ImpL